MNVTDTALPGVKIIEPDVHADARGYFAETWTERAFDALACRVRWVQDNESLSRRGVIRGLHFQRPPHAQAKLVRCPRGAVLDVAVDLRRDSPAYGRHVAVELSADNHRQLFLPKGVAHGFAVLSDEAMLQYKCDEYYHPEADAGISPLDPSLGISWPFDPAEAVLSDKDRRRPPLSALDNPF